MSWIPFARLSVAAALCFGSGVYGSAATAGKDTPGSPDTKPSVDVIDPVRVLSADKALEFEAEVKQAYARLAPSVVRLWEQNEEGAVFDGRELPARKSCSGVIIDRAGLILTCSHHDEAPGTSVTIELAGGKRVAGKFLGRFRLDDPQPMHVGPDLGLARITEAGEWPAAAIDTSEAPVEGQPCLAIGYPGILPPGRRPLLRVGRIAPRFPGLPWLETTTAIATGDSGGPLFNLEGEVVGIASGGDSVAPTRYQPVSPLKDHRERLEAGELVSAANKVVRAARGRPNYAAAFLPAPDLEDQILQMQRSVIRVMDGPHAIAAGLIVDADGWAITKASLVGSRREWTCRLFYVLGDKAIVDARVVATSREHDLALMKVDVRNWPVAPWSADRPAVGTIVSSPLGRSAGPLRFAVVGAEACAEPASPDALPQIPLSIEADEAGTPLVKPSGWKTAEFDAWRDLLLRGDVVTHLDGIETPTASEFGRVMDRLVYARSEAGEVDYSTPAPGSFAGDWVSIGIRRGTESRTVRIPRIHSAHEGALSWHSNPRSLRREAFPVVFAHDGRLRPEECGGPVVDLAGRVVGLNIARSDTTRMLAIPADVLQQVIAALRQHAVGTGK